MLFSGGPQCSLICCQSIPAFQAVYGPKPAQLPTAAARVRLRSSRRTEDAPLVSHAAGQARGSTWPCTVQGDWEEAERFFRESRESRQMARRGSGGESDPQFAATLANLAQMLRLQRRYQEAEPMYREVCLCILTAGLVLAPRCTDTSSGPATPPLTLTKHSGIGCVHCSSLNCLSACCNVY